MDRKQLLSARLRAIEAAETIKYEKKVKKHEER